MAVTISIDEVRRAIRLGDSAEETAELTRLLALATILVQDYAPHAPGALQDEAAVRLIGYLYDQPTLSRPGQYAAAVRNCGMAALLSRYRAIRAGSVGAEPGAGGGGAILPPGSDRGNVSAFAFEFQTPVTNPSTNGQVTILANNGYTIRILNEILVSGPIIKDTVLFSNFGGNYQLFGSIKNRSKAELAILIKREFGADFSKSITHIQSGLEPAEGDSFSIPMNVFNRYDVFKVGQNKSDLNPKTVDLTEQDLSLPHKLTIDVQVLLLDKDLTPYELQAEIGIINYSTFQYQLRQAVATGIDVDLAEFKTELGDLKAKDAAIDVDINTIETQLQSAFRRLVPLPGEAKKGDVLTLDPTLPGANFGWETPSGGGGGGSSNLPNPPAGDSSVKDYNLQIATDGGASWSEDTGGGGGGNDIPSSPTPDDNKTHSYFLTVKNPSQFSPGKKINWFDVTDRFALATALNATDAAVNALDNDVKANTTAIAGKAAQTALTALNQEVNRFGTVAEANRVKLAALKLPNAPAAKSADALYELQVAKDGTVTWQVATAPPAASQLIVASTNLLARVRFSRADTLNNDRATKNFSTADSNALRTFLAKTDSKDLFVVFLITFDGDGSSIIQTQEFTGDPIHLPAAHVPAPLKHFHFNQTYAQVTGDPANTSRGELSITVPEAGKAVSAVLDVSANLKSNNALRNTTTVDVFVYGREFQQVQESKVPDPPAATDADASYELQVDTGGVATWVKPPAPGGGGGPTFTALNTTTENDDWFALPIDASKYSNNSLIDFVIMDREKCIAFMAQEKRREIFYKLRFVNYGSKTIPGIRYVSQNIATLEAQDFSRARLNWYPEWSMTSYLGAGRYSAALEWFGFQTDENNRYIRISGLEVPVSEFPNLSVPRTTPQDGDLSLFAVQLLGVTYG